MFVVMIVVVSRVWPSIGAYVLPGELATGHKAVQLQAFIFVISLHLLLAVNTLIYLVNTWRTIPMSDVPDGSPLLAKAYGYMGIFVVTIAISLIAAVPHAQAFDQLVRTGNVDMHVVFSNLHKHEMALLVIFGLFVVAGKLYEGLCVGLPGVCAMPAERLDKLKLAHVDSERYFWSCDLPGFVGVLAIFVAGMAISEAHGDKIMAEHLIYYKSGFAVGALGLHVVFTQAILAFLSIPVRGHSR